MRARIQKSLLGALLTAGMLVISFNASAAGTDTSTFGVSAQVAQTCVVGSGSATMDFGSLSLLDPATGKPVLSGKKDVDITFPVTCTNGSSGVQLKFTGTAATGFALKSTATPADTVTYTLYSDSYTTALVRDTDANATSFAAFAADGVSHDLRIYGRVDLTQNLKVHDDYADTVTITISY